MSEKKKNNQEEEVNIDTAATEVKEEKQKGKKSRRGSKDAKIEELEQQISELKDKNLRLRAEFENYKKRTVREKIDMMKTAAQDTMAAILPVLDDFDRAKKNAMDENTEEEFSEGVNLVYNKLYTVLKQKGLEPMETNGEVFDPELHESITEIPAPSEDLKGKIVDTIEKGYILKEKIIRHAKVVIGK